MILLKINSQKLMELKKEDYIHIIQNELKEDLHNTGDITGEAIFSKEKGVFNLISKADGILCGKDVFYDVFNEIDKNIKCIFNFNDKDKIHYNDIVAKVKGHIVNILKAERTALNLIGHLTGISTKVTRFVKKTNNKLKILDTRKTMPGLRQLQKYAVFCGGGFNHRMGLYDMILIKDNHIDGAGGITKAVQKIKEKWNNKYKIEVETRNLDEVREALACDIDRIMLDNMDTETINQAIKIINNKMKTEISGNITLKRIAELSETGADYVSIGTLTHTVCWHDFSLKME